MARGRKDREGGDEGGDTGKADLQRERMGERVGTGQERVGTVR